jgi:hypothetical protein
MVLNASFRPCFAFNLLALEDIKIEDRAMRRRVLIHGMKFSQGYSGGICFLGAVCWWWLFCIPALVGSRFHADRARQRHPTARPRCKLEILDRILAQVMSRSVL